MIRRNTAGQVIYLPQLTTTDGTAITSSATLTVAKDGTEAASGGTLAHSANGVWKYTPTQAETDAAIVGLILTGTSAVPVVLNLITTGADTSAVALGANTVAPDNSTIGNIYTVLQLTDADVATLITRIAGIIRTAADDVTAESAQTTAIRSGLALEATLASMKGAGFDTATDSLEAIRNRGDAAWITGSGGGLTGDYTLTVTVTDDADSEPIEGATVTLFRSGERGAESTDANGEAVFGVDAATWTWIVRASGYTSQTGTKVIAANDTLAVELESITVIEPSNPDNSVLTVLCLDELGDPEPDVSIDIRIVTVPSGDTNVAYKGVKQTAASDANGIASLQAIKGAVYEYKRGKAEIWSRVTIGSGATTNVQSFIGSP